MGKDAKMICSFAKVFFLDFGFPVSGKLLTHPSPKPTFCPKQGVSVNVGLGQGQVGSFWETQSFFVNFRPAESGQQKRKEETDQQENPNDARDPSVEQRERLLALDEEIADEEDQSIAKEEETSCKSQAPLSVQCLRSLVCLDDAGKVFSCYV